ncbi:MAG TPA: 4-hydroxy-tetrahydrodipicolinate reductase [Steroidobacteraceae bacterium]|jgi:4-hydroxy-tetrahydrodipicolinate reductase|nr:4-hydroxy-tetrahydrodipicolinate reductase [Steroidobacteraceae bacterium]
MSGAGAGPSAGGAAGAAPATRLVLIGASGRMGLQILQQLPEIPTLRLTGAVASERSGALGRDAGMLAGIGDSGVAICAALPPLLAQADVAVDFSTGTAAAANLAACAAAGVPLLIGTTGLPADLQAPLAAAARHIALLVAPNTSLGVNLLLELVRRAAQALPLSYDIEVLEAHHRHKRDAPSGTALALAGAAAEGRGQDLPERAGVAPTDRSGQRPQGQIGFAAVRGGDVVGEHQVLFLGDGERVSLGHAATDRGVFARGALLAARWLARQPPGRYRMADVLFSKSDT